MPLTESLKLVRNQIFAYQERENVICQLHMHYHMEIVLVTKGILTMRHTGQKVSIPAGSAILILPFEAHSFVGDRDNICQIYEFSPDLLPPFFEYINRKHFLSRTVTLTPSLFSYLLHQDVAARDHDRLYALALLAPLCDLFRTSLSAEPVKKQTDNSVFLALEYLHAHFDEPISLSAVAEQVYLHPVTLSRKFLEVTDTHFHAYLIALRCHEAAKLLLETNKTVTEIAYSTGFSNIRSFNRSFQAFHHMTPGEARKKLPDSSLLKFIVE